MEISKKLWIGIFVVLVIAVGVVLLLPVYDQKPSWCDFSAALRSTGIPVRGSNDTSTLSVAALTNQDLYNIFKDNYTGDDDTGDDDALNYDEAVKIMKEDGKAWAGPNMVGKVFYVSRCGYDSTKFPWRKCYSVLGLTNPRSNFWSQSKVVYKGSCFPDCTVTPEQCCNEN